MISELIKFPQTPHLAWLGNTPPRGDKLLSESEVVSLLVREVVVEEKIDGANIGISRGDGGAIRVQNRGRYLEEPYRGQFARLPSWLGVHRHRLECGLSGNLIAFGEWCAAVHSIEYDALPDWFVLFDVFDVERNKFWSVDKRNRWAKANHLCVVPELARGKIDLRRLVQMLRGSKSQFANAPIEGLVVRKDVGAWSEARGKLVRPEFMQSIADHWTHKAIRWNRLRQG